MDDENSLSLSLSKVCLHASVADPHHIDADTDPACQIDADPDSGPTLHFNADQDPDPSSQIKDQNLDKVLKQARFPYILSCLQIDAN
jgi:hypothetical protein